MHARQLLPAVMVLLLVSSARADGLGDVAGCGAMVGTGLRGVAGTRDQRFLGKVREATARCRGGDRAARYRATPWLDWSNYWGTGDDTSRRWTVLGRLGPTGRGIRGALLDLEYQRIELLKFNLFDNSGTYRAYVEGKDGVAGAALRQWPEMRLPRDHPNYDDVGGAGAQRCDGALIRSRTLTGICNDIYNPAMGSTGMLFGRNVEFTAVLPERVDDTLAHNRHGDRIGLMKPDPQGISRRLLTRAQSHPERCVDGTGLPGESLETDCDYAAAPTLNVLAAFWIQFMTHDWFSHSIEGHNDAAAPLLGVGCRTTRDGGTDGGLTAAEVATLGCRPEDVVDASFVADRTAAEPFTDADGIARPPRAPATFRNFTTAWWDASQIYGSDSLSIRRVKRDPSDPAKLLMVPTEDGTASGPRLGYLPLLQDGDPQNPVWRGQEAVAFGDNFTAGVSFLHNVFAREHNLFVEAFRAEARADPEGDSGLRDPANPERVITYAGVGAEEIYQVARLVVSAEIAKIHTIEWTTQLLYDEPLHLGMNANWNGLFEKDSLASRATAELVTKVFAASDNPERATQWYSVFAAGSGIVGLGSHRYADGPAFGPKDRRKRDLWSVSNPDDVNRGVNHFGSPFNFPEEFATVYRLHALVPDVIEMRSLAQPNALRAKVPVVATFRGDATEAVRRYGLPTWGLSLGRQRLGALTLGNMPRFLQSLPLRGRVPGSRTDRLDVVALDIVRDREHGVPRFNEFRRQYGLRQLTSFDDFVDRRVIDAAAASAEARAEAERQRGFVKLLRDVYGTHRCDQSKVITRAQRDADGRPLDDCLGHPNGTVVDNVEDVDVVVGMLAEFTRPHGFAISETQFQVFILNASRRLFSDRFFTSSYRPEFYSTLGLRWVEENGPDGVVWEAGRPNGHHLPVSPMKRVLLRTMPELAGELAGVVNAFDPWARDRGEYYSVAWKPRPGAESDPAFASP